jgi:hypothetical protein
VRIELRDFLDLFHAILGQQCGTIKQTDSQKVSRGCSDCGKDAILPTPVQVLETIDPRYFSGGSVQDY